MKNRLGLLPAIIFSLILILASCGGSKNNDIDMKQFMEKAKQEKKNISPEKQKEIQKSVFPNIKQKN